MKRFPALIYLFTVLAILGCQLSEEDKERVSGMEEPIPPQEAFDIEFLYSDSGKLKARLIAPHVIEIEEEEEKYSYFDRGVRIEFYTDEQEIGSELTANEGTMDMEKGVAEARGDVLVINEKGERLNTEKLNWDKEQDEIYTDEFVQIRTEEEIIYGDRLRATTDFSTYRIDSIRGTINLREESETTDSTGAP